MLSTPGHLLVARAEADDGLPAPDGRAEAQWEVERPGERGEAALGGESSGTEDLGEQ